MRRIRVVVASPGDVAPERQIVSMIAEELNHILGIEKDFSIDVYRWELDSGLGIHSLGMQGTIDDNLPIESCDIMVAIFGVRFGSEILSSSETGTEHEIIRAFSAWKKSGKPQVFVYFKNSSVRFNEIDFNQGSASRPSRMHFTKVANSSSAVMPSSRRPTTSKGSFGFISQYTYENTFPLSLGLPPTKAQDMNIPAKISCLSDKLRPFL